MSDIRFSFREMVIGYYVLGNGDTQCLKFAMYYKPNWFYRVMMRIAFGITWIDADISF